MSALPRSRGVLRILWAVFLALYVVGCLLPADSPPIRTLASFHVSDDALHFAAFAVLMFLPSAHERRRTLAVMAAAAVIIGLATELGQNASPGRSFELSDMVAGAVGFLVGLSLGRGVFRLRNRKTQLPEAVVHPAPSQRALTAAPSPTEKTKESDIPEAV